MRDELLERYTARVGRRLDVETMRGIAARVRERAARGARKRSSESESGGESDGEGGSGRNVRARVW